MHFNHDMTMPEGQVYEAAVAKAERIIDHAALYRLNGQKVFVDLAKAFLCLHDEAHCSCGKRRTGGICPGACDNDE